MVKNALFKGFCFIQFCLLFSIFAKAQVIDSSFKQNNDTVYLKPEDTIYIKPVDTVLRIKNFSPYFTLHVDSTLDYRFEINKDPNEYYWYLKNSPVGLKINNNGILHFKADKSYFLSGKLKYDNDYKVKLGVQNLDDPKDHVDTTFTLLFYNTDIIPSKIKPTVGDNITISEGDTLTFNLQCENGSFPLESITYYCNYPVRSTTPVNKCGDVFTWVAPYDFIKENDDEKHKSLIIKFIGIDKFFNRDTATVTVKVNQSINFPMQLIEYNKIYNSIESYIVQLKTTFRDLDKKIKRTNTTRTKFDLTSATASLGGTVFSSLPTESEKTTGQILPSVGVALVPVKEAVAPTKSDELNSASLVRNDAKRLEYLLTDNSLVGNKDPDIMKKTGKLKDELQQVQLQLIDVPVADNTTDSKSLDDYFNNPKVAKKYRLKSK
ncbi:MAG TPA: hypothetical protein VMU83_11575 [Hanamia sp.]|nr:hypothetical protein [Hanamia sp.]